MPEQTRNEVEFFRELRVLLDRYDVDIIATDEGKPYGMGKSLVEFQFNRPYGCYQFDELSSADDPANDADAKVSE